MRTAVQRTSPIVLPGSCLAVILLLVANTAIAEPTQCDPTPASFSAGLDTWSSYWFRGGLVTDRLTLQPRATIAWAPAGLEIEAWNSFAVWDRDRLGCCDESDITLTHTRTLRWGAREVESSAGYTQYFFTGAPGSSSHTEEAALGMALDAILSPSLAGYYDMGLYDETYLEVGIAPEIPLRPDDEEALVLEFLLGAGSYGEPFGLRDIDVRCSAGIGLGGGRVAPVIGAGCAPTGPYKDDWKIFGGVSITFGE